MRHCTITALITHSWYELEWADSHMRQNKLAPCLKKAVNVEKHFIDFVEDQLDFHTYCMRKMTLRAYVSMIRLEDNIHEHAFYRTAAKLAVQAYVAIHDNPEYTSRKLVLRTVFMYALSVQQPSITPCNFKRWLSAG
eukprot:17832-Heterococcus_DN1.PRE.3